MIILIYLEQNLAKFTIKFKKLRVIEVKNV
jgi:hypothetical protein